MKTDPSITLEQWRALVAAVDEGGYAQAALALSKSQSSITYAVQKIESLLSVEAFELKGRRAVLTPTGHLLYRRARALLEEAQGLENAAQQLSAGWEAEIRLSVEAILPNRLVLRCLDQFARESPNTRIEVFETVLGGTEETIRSASVDLVLAPRLPAGLLADTLLRMRFIAAAHPEHPLHKLGRTLTARDLKKHRHLVVRESGLQRTASLALDVEQRWTFTRPSTSIQAACMGLGFSWYAEEMIKDELAEGRLKPLPLKAGAERFVDLYLAFPKPDAVGPGTRRLAELILHEVQQECRAR